MMKDIYKMIKKLIEKEEGNVNYYLAIFTIDNFKNIINYTIDEFAKRSNCSKPSIIRFCQKLGCTGFAEFKFKIKNYLEIERKINLDLIVDQKFQVIDTEYLKIANLTFNQVYTFYDTHKKMMTKIVQKIVTAKRIYVFSTSLSYQYSKNFCDRLSLWGLNIIQENDYNLIIKYLDNMQEKDIVICFSLSGTSCWINQIDCRLKNSPNYKFAVLGLNSPFQNFFDDVVLIPQFESQYWNLYSIRAQALAQFLDYIYVDLSKKLFYKSQK